jgi:DNA-binding HxlR family transcriptional regulator
MSTEPKLPAHLENVEYPNLQQQRALIGLSEVFGRKWNPVILAAVRDQNKGFTELKREIDGISGKMLAESLEVLTEQHGILERQVLNNNSKQVKYTLTPAGEKLLPALRALQNWASEYKGGEI